MKAGTTSAKQAAARPAKAPARTPARETAVDPTGLLELQRQVGNRAVRALLDGAAAPGAGAGAPRGPAQVRLRAPLRPQAKLAIGPADDEFEREADRVAAAVTRMAAPPEPDAQPVIHAANPRIQRKCAACGAAGDEPCTCVQRKAESSAPPAGAIGDHAPSALRTGGQPLSSRDRRFFEPRFGADFGRVRIHSDAAAAAMAQALHAQAFTVGGHIVFGAGRFTPETRDGQRLLAHELTHVVQQSSGQVEPGRIQFKSRGEEDLKVVKIIETQGRHDFAQQQLSDGTIEEIDRIGSVDIDPGTYRCERGASPYNYSCVAVTPSPTRRFSFNHSGKPLAATIDYVVVRGDVKTLRSDVAKLSRPIQNFLAPDKGAVGSYADLDRTRQAGLILQEAGVTEDELLLQRQRRIDLQELGLRQGEDTDPVAWALRYSEYREQTKTGERANATTLLETAKRLSLASLNLYQQDPLLEIIEPSSKISALATMNAIRFKEARPRRGPPENVETPFSDIGALRITLWNFEKALVSDLRSLVTVLLDATEAKLIRMNLMFVGLGQNKRGSPANLERTIEEVKKDPDVARIQKTHEAYKASIEREERDDREHRHSLSEIADPVVEEEEYLERSRQRERKLETERQQYLDELRKKVAEKSFLKLPPGYDIGELLFAKSGQEATLNLIDVIVDGRAKVREGRDKLDDRKFLYAADNAIAQEKDELGKALGAERGSVVNWIIDEFARERRSQTTIWQDIWKVFEFASNFIPGPLGWAARGLVAAVDLDRKMTAAREQSVQYSIESSDIAPDPHAGAEALLEFGASVAIDKLLTPSGPGRAPLTLGLGNVSRSTERPAFNLAGDLGRGEIPPHVEVPYTPYVKEATAAENMARQEAANIKPEVRVERPPEPPPKPHAKEPVEPLRTEDVKPPEQRKPEERPREEPRTEEPRKKEEVRKEAQTEPAPHRKEEGEAARDVAKTEAAPPPSSPPPPPSPLSAAEQRILDQQGVVATKRGALKEAEEKTAAASQRVSEAKAAVQAAEDAVANAEREAAAARKLAQEKQALADAAPKGARRAPKKAATAAKNAAEKADAAVGRAGTAVKRARKELTDAQDALTRRAKRIDPLKKELQVSEDYLERMKAAKSTEAPRLRRGETFDPAKRRPNLSEFDDLPYNDAERFAGLRKQPEARVAVYKAEVAKDFRAEHDALMQRLKNGESPQAIGHEYEQLMKEDLSRDASVLRRTSTVGDKTRVSDYGVQEFTIETDLGDGKLDQLWRDLQTPIPGAKEASNEILLTVPRLSKKGADRLAKMAAIYEHLTGHRPKITVRETML